MLLGSLDTSYHLTASFGFSTAIGASKSMFLFASCVLQLDFRGNRAAMDMNAELQKNVGGKIIQVRVTRHLIRTQKYFSMGSLP